MVSDPLSAVIMKFIQKGIGSDGRDGRLLREGDPRRLSNKVSLEIRLDLLREPIMWRSRENILGRVHRKFKRTEARTNTRACLRKSQDTAMATAV